MTSRTSRNASDAEVADVLARAYALTSQGRELRQRALALLEESRAWRTELRSMSDRADQAEARYRDALMRNTFDPSDPPVIKR